MYQKELKKRFRKIVNRQANLAKNTGQFSTCMWICIYYFEGLNDAVYTTRNFLSYVEPFTTESFEYIFRSIVEYRKGVR